MSDWKRHSARIGDLLSQLVVTRADGTAMSPDDGYRLWCERTAARRDDAGTLYLVGNGASASMASHCAADLLKQCGARTTVLTDPALATAYANDTGYDQVFAGPLRALARPEDMLVAISSSGRSTNVLCAVEVAVDLRIDVVTVSAMKPDNPLRQRGALNFYVPARTYGDAESCHAAVLHYWMDRLNVEQRTSNIEG